MTILTRKHNSTKTTTSILSLTISILISLHLPSPIYSQNCQRFCGKISLNYPFGSGPGCGDPQFQHYLTCNNQELTFNTHKASYQVTSIDYSNQVVYISDTSISTCSCSNPSKGFGLDWDAPFSIHDDTVFALLDCSLENSPIYNPRELNSNASLCDKQGLSICSFLYSCRAISTTAINMPISTCCVYTPVDLGPVFDIDLEELKCGSYSGFYSFDGRKSDPNKWKYGVALKYKLSVYNEFPSYCGDCERSFGVCGYVGSYNSFICNCPSGLNSSTDCFFGYGSNHGSKLLPWETSIGLMVLVHYSALLLFWLF